MNSTNTAIMLNIVVLTATVFNGNAQSTCIVTVTNKETGKPIANAEIIITTIAGNSNTVLTNSSGKCFFPLNTGRAYKFKVHKLSEHGFFPDRRPLVKSGIHGDTLHVLFRIQRMPVIDYEYRFS